MICNFFNQLASESAVTGTFEVECWSVTGGDWNTTGIFWKLQGFIG